MGKKDKLIKIAITGPESTGKSLLAQELADHYRTVCVPEFARVYLLKLDGEYTQNDILEIAKGQKATEDVIAGLAKKVLFADTELLVTKIWSDFKYGKCDPWIEEAFRKQHYDLYLLMDVDIPWQYDPMRENPEQRKELFDLYRSELDQAGFKYSIVSGLDEERLNNAIRIINDTFKPLF